uniref:Uncharacterized protein n=1 Tax=Arundo donax TaxID=35708 RepID=A0A0A8Y5W1_ARUDO
MGVRFISIHDSIASIQPVNKRGSCIIGQWEVLSVAMTKVSFGNRY